MQWIVVVVGFLLTVCCLFLSKRTAHFYRIGGPTLKDIQLSSGSVLL